MAYAYQAALWCDSCGRDIKKRLDAEGKENTGDSNDYPQYSVDPGESDSPSHCDAGEECLEAEILSSGTKVGAILSDDLTEEGIKYVIKAAKDGGEVAQFWVCHFGIDLDVSADEEDMEEDDDDR